jgi:pimeloyl-ACP methyl ester carboxylesterase
MTAMNRNTKHVSTPCGDIAYTEHGTGPAALFVHGVFLNGYYWRHVIDLVTDMRRCIAIDLLAHGATGASAVQDLSFSAQADMLDAFCTALALEPVDLVANDSGGAIAQIFAARHPERIRSLTLTNCDTHDNWPLPAFQPVVRAAERALYADLGPKMLADVALARSKFAPAYELPERVSADTFRTYLEPVFGTPAAIRNIERFITSMDPRHTVAVEPLLRQVQAPTLVVWGTDDVYFSVKWAYWLRGTIPNCRKVVELAGARLFFPEERPEELARALRGHWQVINPSATASVAAV